MKIRHVSMLTYIYIVLSLKLMSIGIAAYAQLGQWRWVPRTEAYTLAIAFAFVVSSMVFLQIIPKLGFLSSCVYGALTFYGAVTSLFYGKYIVWSVYTGVTGLLLVAVALYAWRQSINNHF
ncbi:hypothetical protein ALMA_1295 [Alloscardovia macacae]|uniref:Uncharacterized protein n=1 Tax=Alloscardovia macacae TaxID=1160091 RepID=A0A261F3P0_9BIFI|nr:hypothetical protein ALMA_1295 [Alloscardovia macacae]